MHRQPLIDALLEYQPRFPEEHAMVQRFVDFVRAHERCFHRDCLPGHVTGSAWIVNPSRDAVLLTHHRKLDRWLQPGGHSDGDANPRAVARREGEEETGLALELVSEAVFDVDIHDIPARGSEPQHQHFDVRFAFVATHDDYVVSDESHDLAWAPLAGLDRYTQEVSVVRMLEKWQARG